MSLQIKCFATVISAEGSDYLLPTDEKSDGHLEIHSTLYDLSSKDFFAIIFNLKKEVANYSAFIKIGDPVEREIICFSSPIFTSYAFDEKNNTPIPIINQPISKTKSENSDFKSSRFWAYKKYFFVTNRNYSENELSEVRMKIHYIVKKFDDELNSIANELKLNGIHY